MKKILRILFLFLSTVYFLFSTAFAQWGPDVRLSYNDSISHTSYNNAWCVVASGDTVYVVWYDNRDGGGYGSEIYYKRSTDGGTVWENDTRLTNIAPWSAFYPSIAVWGSNVHVVWYSNFNWNYEIYYKRSTDGGTTWENDTRLTNDIYFSEYPSISVWGSNVHVVWSDDKYGNYEIYYKRSTDGGTTWENDTRLTNNPSYSGYPSVSVSDSVVHVVWYDFRDGNYEIYYKRSTDAGLSWETDTRLTNARDGSWYPSVSASGSMVHVVWHDKRDGSWKIYYKRSTDGGTAWENDTRLTNNPSYSGYPSVSVSDSMVHVVWFDERDGDYEIYYKRSTDSGLNWSQDTRLTNNQGWSWRSSVSASGRKVHVVWEDFRDGNYEVYYKRNPTGNVGIEENQIANLEFRIVKLKITPNPFTSYATIQGYEKEKFIVYDITGRVVGTYKGEKIGEDLRAGVYFVRAEEQKSGSLLRIVKVR